MRYLLCIFTFLTAFSSCSVKRVQEKDIYTIDAIEINKSLLVQIDSFQKSHPNIKSMVILTDANTYIKEDGDVHHYFIISPAYQDISFLTGHTPSVYFYYKNTHVFMQSSLDGLINSTMVDDLYNQFCIKKDYRKENKLIWELFFEDALIIDKINSDSVICISNKADTFLKKKRVTFIPPPLKNCEITD